MMPAQIPTQLPSQIPQNVFAARMGMLPQPGQPQFGQSMAMPVRGTAMPAQPMGGFPVRGTAMPAPPAGGIPAGAMPLLNRFGIRMSQPGVPAAPVAQAPIAQAPQNFMRQRLMMR